MRFDSITLDKPFRFEAGGSIETLKVAFHTSDREYTPGEPVVWICHALTANSDPTDWWPGMAGEGKTLDPAKYFVVCVNMLGSPYGSSAPTSMDPATGRQYLLDFPKVTVRDIVRANIEVRKHLGINKIDLIIGSSIGGFQAVEWAIMEPDVISKAVFMATAERVPAYLTAYEEAQRMALEADPTFREARSAEGGKAGLECARAIALISYRSFEGYKRTQSEQSPDTLFAGRAASYERYQGKKLSARFDAYCYWTLSNSLDSQNVGRGRGGVEAALACIKAETLCIGIKGDCIFPAPELAGMASLIPGARYAEIESDFGHDGFLLEDGQITNLITPLLPCR